MRFIYGQGWTHFADDTDGDDTNGATGGTGGEDGEVVDDGGGDGGGASGGGDGARNDDGVDDHAADDKKAPAKKDEKKDQPVPLIDALDAALGYKKDAEGFRLDVNGNRTHGPDGKPLAEDDPTRAAKAAAGAKAGTETETHWANGKPKKDAKGNEVNEKGEITKAAAPAKVKTSAELVLTPQQMAVLKPEARARFQEMTSALKSHEGTIARLTEEIAPLKQARDNLASILQETQTSKEDLLGYLEFNANLRSGSPEGLKAALKVIEETRLEIYTALGIEPEGGGVDLLASHPDLAKRVENEELSRADALELAKARNLEKERSNAGAAARRTAEAQKEEDEAADNALESIKAWTKTLAASDLDYKAKEGRLLAVPEGGKLSLLQEVMRDYPPEQWLPTLKRLYSTLTVAKKPAASGGNGGNQPLRPRASRPGQPAPTTSKEALDQALGYTSSG